MTYILEKYKGQTTRFICPKCGRRHSFTRYINKETGEYISPLVGICNRAIKCGYHFTPKQFFENNNSLNSMDKMDKKDTIDNNPRRDAIYRVSSLDVSSFDEPKLDKPSSNNPSSNNPSLDNQSSEKPKSPKEITPIKQIDKRYLQKTFGKESNFLTFLKNTFPEDKVEQVILDYFLSGTKDKSVIYWQIDKQGRIRTGKIMQYNPETGHRVKAGLEPAPTGNRKINKPPISWIHSELKHKGILPMDWQMTQCLFGEHLITKYPQKPVMLVESEKTAIVMTCFYSWFNWLATGGLQNLKMEKLYSIRKLPIIAYPDLKCYELWKDKAEKINKEIGSKIVVSHYLEEFATKEQKEKGLDIADVYLMVND